MRDDGDASFDPAFCLNHPILKAVHPRAHRVNVQDFRIMVPGAGDLNEVMEVTTEVCFAAGDIAARKGRFAGIAGEGGGWPEFTSNEEALLTLVAAIDTAGERPGDRVVISLDIAASEFGRSGACQLARGAALKPRNTRNPATVEPGREARAPERPVGA